MSPTSCQTAPPRNRNDHYCENGDFLQPRTRRRTPAHVTTGVLREPFLPRREACGGQARRDDPRWSNQLWPWCLLLLLLLRACRLEVSTCFTPRTRIAAFLALVMSRWL